MSKTLKQFSANGSEYKLMQSFGKYKIFISNDSNIGMAKLLKPIATFNERLEAENEFIKLKEKLT